MIIAEIKGYIEGHLTSATDDLRSKFAEIVAYVEGNERTIAATIAAEVADLTARGYTVTAPADQPVAA